MPISEFETVASLKLLVAIAKADGTLAPEERAVFEEAFKGAKLPGGITAQGLLDGTYDVGELARGIASPEAREAAFSSAMAMAYADRQCQPEEQAILDTLDKTWILRKETKGLLSRMFQETQDTLSVSSIQPIADPKKRQAEIKEDVLKYSILSAVLGANPIPGVSVATDLAVVALQAKMFRDIGQYWGHESTKEGVKQIIGGLGVGTGARIAVTNLAKFVPGWGSVVGATASFASTWALGKVANQYWQEGGKVDLKTLRDAFKSAEKEGRKAYEKNKATIEEKQKANKARLDQLAADYQAGKISQADYERQVAELK